MQRKPLAFAFIFALALAGCGPKEASAPKTESGETPTKTATNGDAPAPAGSLKDLKIEDLKPGEGDAAAKGDQVWVLYTGKLGNGKVFDSTKDHENKPLSVVIGARQVIEGWDKGLVGMKVGGTRKLSIPYRMGYGEEGSDKIPGMADLFFEVEMVAMVKQGEERTVQAVEEKVGTGREVKRGDKVTIDYVTTLPNHDEVENTYQTKKPVSFVVGKNQALDGIDQGIIGMKVGGIRTLTLPPTMGLPGGAEKVPSNSVMIFRVELKKIG